ncbi:hypothetical protein [Fredinandcohnia quinoae]|uniref:Uncharacterized protein n=1 Tax=Fredinandcohnia quinoae TaxID=2918902 RepID=A0AAW5E941_9BACI|nr:hypothetical protein [Fredinandcohnia sp. SECRCQ15]MCH1627755.1 hypothetical protein [Fredinandcohnia sp. SECRCQ15]
MKIITRLSKGRGIPAIFLIIFIVIFMLQMVIFAVTGAILEIRSLFRKYGRYFKNTVIIPKIQALF